MTSLKPGEIPLSISLATKLLVRVSEAADKRFRYVRLGVDFLGTPDMAGQRGMDGACRHDLIDGCVYRGDLSIRCSDLRRQFVACCN